MVAVVPAMATALLQHMHTVDERGKNIMVRCRYCRASAVDNHFFEADVDDVTRDLVKHHPDCIALIARDVLGGSDAQQTS